MKNKKILIAKSLAVIFMVFGLTYCEIQEDFEYTHAPAIQNLDVSAWDYIQSSDTLSVLKEAINLTGTSSYFSGTTAQTFVLPWNPAMNSFIASLGYAQLSEVPVPILKNMILYHVIDEPVSFDDVTYIDVNVPFKFESGNGQTIYLSHDGNFIGKVNYQTNKVVSIRTSNIKPTNGVIHITGTVSYLNEIIPTEPGIELDGSSDLTQTALNTVQVASGGNTVISKSYLEYTGEDPIYIKYRINAIPSEGWLIYNGKIMSDGDSLTQADINLKNLVYVHNGSTNNDSFLISAEDLDGGSDGPLTVDITVQ